MNPVSISKSIVVARDLVATAAALAAIGGVWVWISEADDRRLERWANAITAESLFLTGNLAGSLRITDDNGDPLVLWRTNVCASEFLPRAREVRRSGYDLPSASIVDEACSNGRLIEILGQDLSAAADDGERTEILANAIFAILNDPTLLPETNKSDGLETVAPGTVDAIFQDSS